MLQLRLLLVTMVTFTCSCCHPCLSLSIHSSRGIPILALAEMIGEGWHHTTCTA
ncbi:hypothetical protein BDA96_10G043500 [Sorghum bicolor]|uniref:Uncharacterized protein n=1 Tax=Sorghum bicolor TaxID=4558 RepID=A0A921PYS2_SORBI|nr:hypothetical protein BDA96_10G043500 [Sorghum bicolor]